MKHYLLAVHMTEGTPIPSEEEIQQAYRDTDAFNAEIQASGAWVFAGGLLPPDTATVVRAQGGKVVTTDGPFAETKEQLGGFWVIKVADLDAALDYAARASEACRHAGGGPAVRGLPAGSRRRAWRGHRRRSSAPTGKAPAAPWPS